MATSAGRKATTVLGLGALAAVAGGAVLAFALVRTPATLTPEMSPDQIRAMGAAVATLDASFKEAHATALERARTISGNDYLKNGLKSGDPATAQDQVKRGETKFSLKDGELVEIGITMPDGKLQVLSRQPENAPASGVGGKPQSIAKISGSRLLVYEVVEVEDAGKQVGYVTVVQATDLAPALDQLASAGIQGRLELADATIDVAGGPPAAATTQPMALAEPNARLVVAKPAPRAGSRSMALVGAGAGLGGLGLLVILIGLLTGKKARASDPLSDGDITQLTGPGIATATTTATPSASAELAAMSANGGSLGAGAMIGRWEVIRRLGSGGMADVYLAHSKGEAGFEKLVAIKVMHAHLARSERAVEHFLDEARLAARIHHPNVVAIQDLGKIGSEYVIVMEYVDGVDLERLLISTRNAGRLVPLDVGLGILRRICDGLEAAHGATAADGTPLELIHRDVKAANVLVSRQGGVKVVDFGIAKAATQSHMTQVGETKGTPSMMAPEQRVGEPVDVRADVYSTAAVGYELLTGHGVNLDLAALAHLGVDNWPHLPPPTSLRPEIPAELDAILLTAMAFDRERRPANCQVFEEQLEEVMKRHNLAAADKDIARWVDGELRMLVPAFESTSASKPAVG